MRTPRVLALSALCLLWSALAPAASAEEEPKLLGMADRSWSSTMDDFADEAGKQAALLQVFFQISETLDRNWLHVQLDTAESLGLTFYHEITVDDLGALNQGDLDGSLDTMAANYASWLLEAPGRHMLVAPLPEANLAEHSWGGDPSGYRAGYARIRQAFLDAGLGPEQVRFVFSMNGVDGSFSSYYPGGEIVDIIGFSKLNRGSPWRDYEETFTTHIRELQEEISHDKPILITQTATVGGSGRAAWLEDMFSGLLTEDQVIGAIYFNISKDYDYRVLVDGELDATFAAGYRTWSDPSAVDWVFDGGMDGWVADRAGAVFVDAIDSMFRTEIEWLAAKGITEGCAERRFCPSDPVTRAQMASFLDRALPFAATGDDAFTDDAGSVHEPAINRLAAAGVTRGCTDTTFCPSDPVTRGQMASFLTRALDLETGPDAFDDDEGSVHEDSINALAAAGITQGCTETSFCPDEAVTRGQMAAFLYRALAG